jgi:hypothetical protein
VPQAPGFFLLNFSIFYRRDQSGMAVFPHFSKDSATVNPGEPKSLVAGYAHAALVRFG